MACSYTVFKKNISSNSCQEVDWFCLVLEEGFQMRSRPDVTMRTTPIRTNGAHRLSPAEARRCTRDRYLDLEAEGEEGRCRPPFAVARRRLVPSSLMGSNPH